MDKINRLASELQNLLLNLDSLNVVHLTAETIDTGTLNANLVTILSQLLNGGFIRLDGNGIVINDGTQDTFVADFSGNVTLKGIINALGGVIGGFTIGLTKLSGDGIIEGGTIIGALIKTAADKSRMEFTDQGIRSYNDNEQLEGLVVENNNFSDINLYYQGQNRGGLGQVAGIIQLLSLIGSIVVQASTGSYTRLRGNVSFEADSVTGIPISGVSGLEARLKYLEDRAFTLAYRTPGGITFNSKNIPGVDTVPDSE